MLPSVDFAANLVELRYSGTTHQPASVGSVHVLLLPVILNLACGVIVLSKKSIEKVADECGVVAEVLKYLPDSGIDTLVAQSNDLMKTGQVPTDWRKTSFEMLLKTMRLRFEVARHVDDGTGTNHKMRS